MSSRRCMPRNRGVSLFSAFAMFAASLGGVGLLSIVGSAPVQAEDYGAAFTATALPPGHSAYTWVMGAGEHDDRYYDLIDAGLTHEQAKEQGLAEVVSLMVSTVAGQQTQTSSQFPTAVVLKGDRMEYVGAVALGNKQATDPTARNAVWSPDVREGTVNAQLYGIANHEETWPSSLQDATITIKNEEPLICDETGVALMDPAYTTVIYNDWCLGPLTYEFIVGDAPATPVSTILGGPDWHWELAAKPDFLNLYPINTSTNFTLDFLNDKVGQSAQSQGRLLVLDPVLELVKQVCSTGSGCADGDGQWITDPSAGDIDGIEQAVVWAGDDRITGNTIEWRLTATNTGNTTLFNVTVGRDAIKVIPGPSGVIPTMTENTCVGTDEAPLQVAPYLQAVGGTLPIPSTQSINCSITFDSLEDFDGEIVNTAVLNSDLAAAYVLYLDRTGVPHVVPSQHVPQYDDLMIDGSRYGNPNNTFPSVPGGSPSYRYLTFEDPAGDPLKDRFEGYNTDGSPLPGKVPSNVDSARLIIDDPTLKVTKWVCGSGTNCVAPSTSAELQTLGGFTMTGHEIIPTGQEVHMVPSDPLNGWVKAAEVPYGSTAQWLVVVTNTGNTYLSNVSLADTASIRVETPVNVPINLAGLQGQLDAALAATNGIMAPGQSIPLTTTTANVSATGDWAGEQPTVLDDWQERAYSGGTDLVNTASATAKATDSQGNDLLDSTGAIIGGTVTSNVSLAEVRTDPPHPGLKVTKWVCPTANCEASPDLARLSGVSLGADGVEVVTGQSDGGWAKEAVITYNSAAQWLVVVANSGDVNLTNVRLTDVGAVGAPAEGVNLAPGEARAFPLTTPGITNLGEVVTGTDGGDPDPVWAEPVYLVGEDVTVNTVTATGQAADENFDPMPKPDTASGWDVTSNTSDAEVSSQLIPDIELNKYDTLDGDDPALGHHPPEDPKGLEPGQPTPISLTIRNTGTEDLVDVVVADATTAGTGTITGLTCDFSLAVAGAPTSGLTWAGPFPVGTSFKCTGTVPALEVGQNHTDKATVNADGRYTGRPVEDEQEWSAEVPSVTIVKYDVLNGDDATTGHYPLASNPKPLASEVPTPIEFKITNNGSEDLIDVTVSDRLTAGSGAITGLTCDFSQAAAGAPTTGVTWAGPFAVGASFICTGTVPGLAARATHSDQASVVGTGAESGKQVDDSDTWNAVVLAPDVELNKYDTLDGDDPALGYHPPEDPKGLVAGQPTPISLTIRNTGTEDLVDVVVADATTAGSGTITGLTCDFSMAAAGAPTSGLTWAGPFPVGTSFKCTGTVPALLLGQNHTDKATVNADGRYTGRPVEDEQEWSGEVPSVTIVKYDTLDGDDATTGHHPLASNPKMLVAEVPTPIEFKITNTGSEALVNVTVADRLTGGSGAITGLTCDFSQALAGAPTSGVTWAGPFAVGASFLCTGTVPGLAERATHSDQASVVGYGAESGNRVDDTDNWNAVVPAPDVELNKYDTLDGDDPALGHHPPDDPKGLVAGQPTPISLTIRNTGTEDLVDVVVADATTAGTGTITGLTCDFSLAVAGAPTSGLTWAGPFPVGTSFKCSGTVPALAVGQNHTDKATVNADGRYTGRPVDDEEEWSGEVPSVTIVKYDVLDGDNQTTGHYPLASSPKELAADVPTPIELRITNTGSEDLVDVTVSDRLTAGTGAITGLTCDFSQALAGAPTSGLTWAGPFAVGASFVCTGTVPGLAELATHSDRASVVGTGAESGRQVDASDTWNAKVPAPDVELTKYDTLNGDNAQTGHHPVDPKGLVAGQPTPISLTIRNNGNEDLVDIAVTDVTTAGTGTITGLTCDFSAAAAGAPTSGVTWAGPFPVGASFTCTGTVPALAVGGSHTDQAKVTAEGRYTGKPVEDEDEWKGEVPEPGVSIVKYDVLNGDDATTGHYPDTSNPKTLTAGTATPIKFTITNTGEDNLINVRVTDELTGGQGAIGDLTCSFPAGGERTETTWAGPFLIGASFTCTGTVPALAAGQTHSDKATVTGTGQISGGPVTDDDTWNGNVPSTPTPREPGVTLTKYDTLDDDDATTGHYPDPANPKQLVAGAPTPISLTIRNSGTEDLVDVVVTDTTTAGVGQISDLTCSFPEGGARTATTWAGPFAVGTSFICTGTVPALAAGQNHTDRATVTADGQGTGTTVRDQDDWNGRVPPEEPIVPVEPKVPEITLVKYDTLNGDDIVTGRHPDTPKKLEAGQPTPISFRIVNTGTDDLVDVLVTDKTTEGAAVITGLTCDFSTASAGGPTAGTTWDGPFLPNTSFTCTGTLPPLAAGQTHTDLATVTARGAASNQGVTASDQWKGMVPIVASHTGGTVLAPRSLSLAGLLACCLLVGTAAWIMLRRTVR